MDSAATNDAARIAALTRDLATARQDLEALTYAISHDLRAPLRSINAFNQLLQRENEPPLGDHSKHCLARIQEGVSRMSNLIEALLQVSRVGATDLTTRDIDFSALAREVAIAVQARHPERSVNVSIEDGMQLHCDQRLMRLVLQALIDNAYKFTLDRDDARIYIGSIAAAVIPTYFVKDNGIGFDNAYAAKLGWPFQKLHTDTRLTGVGIGLAIAQRIVARHGGRLWGEGEVDRGASLYFSLPA